MQQILNEIEQTKSDPSICLVYCVMDTIFGAKRLD